MSSPAAALPTLLAVLPVVAVGTLFIALLIAEDNRSSAPAKSNLTVVVSSLTVSVSNLAVKLPLSTLRTKLDNFEIAESKEEDKFCELLL